MDLLIFLAALSILVLTHEFGHFIMAVKNGIWVEEFGLGLPPRIFGKRIGKTLFSLNWLPIGGFCKLYGEDIGSVKKKKDMAFCNKKAWQKLLVVTGGVIMNVVTAIVIFTVVYSIFGVPVETDKVKIIDVAKNSPAEEAGLKLGDWVEKVGGEDVEEASELIEKVGKFKGEEVELMVKRGEEEMLLRLKVRQNPPEGEGGMGVVISTMENRKLRWWEFYKGIGAGFKEAYFWGKIIINGVWDMISSLFRGQVPKDVSGPVGMFKATSTIKKEHGLLALLHFFGIVSVNLAVVNLLPFPALDGGRMIFVLFEMLTGKKVKASFEAMVNNVGMMILLGLLLLVTIGDVSRLF
ncbi:hypothetical protein DRH14_01280 [Candidatus Shapirobacteria bacterium]|nr:MAG: hypothetical protein DRH14_01280 [Candidatus Shapirobacteria bacterium]